MKRLLLMICGAIFLLSALLTSSALAQTPSMGDLPEDRQHLKRDTPEVSPPVTEGAKENWQLGLSATYMSGKYGTDVRTDTVYVPLSIRRYFQDGDITLVVPYVRITSNGSVTFVNGVPTRVQTAGSTGRTTHEGLGDVVLQGRYYIVNDRDYVPAIALTAHVKAPTANAHEGLGTGDWDEGIGAEVSKFFAESWVVFLDAGYSVIGNPTKVIGRPGGVPLDHQWWNYDAGLGYYFTKALFGSAFYEEWRALVPGTVNPRDALVSFTYKVTQTVRLNLTLVKGLSHDAPEYGATLGTSLRF